MTGRLTIVASEGRPGRQCGECQLCCKLLPMKADQAGATRTALSMVDAGVMSFDEITAAGPEIAKPASVRCQHQRASCGCAIYKNRPLTCMMWNCRWLVGEAGDTRRPDRAHYVIDIIPDVITAETDPPTIVPVIQVWLDPRFPDAHRDPALRAYLHRQAEERGEVALIRYNAHDAFVLIAPPLTGTGEWIENRTNTRRVSGTGMWSDVEAAPLARLAQAVADETGSPVQVQVLKK